MLQNKSKTISVQSESTIKGTAVVRFSSSVSSDGNMGQLFQSIVDNKLYLDNIQEISADRLTFQNDLIEAQIKLMQSVHGSDSDPVADPAPVTVTDTETPTTETPATETDKEG